MLYASGPRLAPSARPVARGARQRARASLRGAAHQNGRGVQIILLPQSSLVFSARPPKPARSVEMRTNVPIRSLPKYVAQAFVAVEDQRFYQHDGVDVIGVLCVHSKGKADARTAAVRARIIGPAARRLHASRHHRPTRRSAGPQASRASFHEQAARARNGAALHQEKILEALHQPDQPWAWFGMEWTPDLGTISAIRQRS